MSVKVNGQRVLRIEEIAAASYLTALLLLPLLETVAIYEAGRRAGETKPLWEPF